MNKKPIFIAEVKTQSPYGFKSTYSRYGLLELAMKYGDWVSVHTDPRFGGSFDDIFFVKRQTNKPVLAKGFHCHNDDVKKAFDLGADYVLIVDRFNRNLFDIYGDRLLFEFSNFSTLCKTSYDLLEMGKVVYNGRDLSTGIGKKSIIDYLDYRKLCHWVCGASLIHHPKDVKCFYPDCDAFIVGENLVHYCSFL